MTWVVIICHNLWKAAARSEREQNHNLSSPGGIKPSHKLTEEEQQYFVSDKWNQLLVFIGPRYTN